MSSEMRELVIRALQSAYAHGEKHAPFALHDCARQIVDAALLARTEAWADRPVAEISELSGAKLIVLYSADEIGHLPKGTKLYTHPQDASGDAIEAQRYRWLRDEASRAQLEMFADRRGTRLAADRVCDAGIDIAMQAKEAK